MCTKIHTLFVYCPGQKINGIYELKTGALTSYSNIENFIRVFLEECLRYKIDLYLFPCIIIRGCITKGCYLKCLIKVPKRYIS